MGKTKSKEGIKWKCPECKRVWTITEEEASNIPGTLTPRCLDCASAAAKRLVNDKLRAAAEEFIDSQGDKNG